MASKIAKKKKTVLQRLESPKMISNVKSEWQENPEKSTSYVCHSQCENGKLACPSLYMSKDLESIKGGSRPSKMSK